MLDLWWKGHAQGKGTPWVTGMGVGQGSEGLGRRWDRMSCCKAQLGHKEQRTKEGQRRLSMKVSQGLAVPWVGAGVVKGTNSRICP